MSETRSVSCNDETIELYAMNRLPERDLEPFEEHLLLCEPCRDRLEETERYVRAMRAGAQKIRNEERVESARKANAAGNWFRIPVMAWAAAAVLVVSGIAIGTRELGRGPITPRDEITVALEASRGSAVSVAPNKPLNLNLDARGLESASVYRVQIVDAAAKQIQDLKVAGSGDLLHVALPSGLKTGTYFVRVGLPGTTDPLREYALDVK